VLAKQYRLCKEHEIKRVLQKGKRLHAPFFTVFVLQRWIKKESFDEKNARLTVIVSKKYDKRAVHRNALKRKFREAVHHDVISLRKHLDIIILPKKNARDVSYQDIFQALHLIFGKI
jgi:ribonuclease P protein component